MENKISSLIKNKVAFDNRRRIIALVGSALLIVGGVASTFFATKTKVDTEEDVLYSYDITADSEYKVYLKENAVYEGEFLTEGSMYSRKLTDHIEVTFKLNFAGQGQVIPVVGGDYQVNAVLEGFQSKDNDKRKIYDKKFPLKDGVLAADANGNINLEETFNVVMDEYAEQMTNIEEELGGSTEKTFYIELSGKTKVTSGDVEQEKDFAYSVVIPLDLANSFYEVEKPTEFKESGSITESRVVTVEAKPYMLILSILPILIGILLGLFVFFATKLPSEDERWIIKMKRLLRRYGSRLVFVENLEERGKVCKVRDMNSLLSISEELHQPILCRLNSEELPDDGRFIVQDRDSVFFLHIPR